MQLNERLRELRNERGLRLRDIAKEAGISVPYLSDLERGRTTPSLDTLGALAAAYQITVHDLLHGVEFYGAATTAGLPRGLQALLDDPTYGPQITPDWVRTLQRIELRGKRPQHKDDWLGIFLQLRRVLGEHG